MFTVAGSKRSLLMAALAGGLLSAGIGYLTAGPGPDVNGSMEARINTLEASLAAAQNELKSTQLLLHTQNAVPTAQTIDSSKRTKDNSSNCGNQNVVSDINVVQALRNLEISPENDSRTFVEKASDLLSGNPTRDKIAIVSKGIFDMARDRGHLPDEALQSMYNNQTDPDLKRVIAQVLSQRGNDSLLVDQVSKAQERLKSGHPRERQDALVQLAKIRNVKAADAILPLLRDPDINVRLDALLALRNNGNAMNVGYVEMMRNDPNTAVSTLANDVANDLRDLSASARTIMTTSDIEAGLPPM